VPKSQRRTILIINDILENIVFIIGIQRKRYRGGFAMCGEKVLELAPAKRVPSRPFWNSVSACWLN